MKNEKIKKIIEKLNEINVELTNEVFFLECMDENNEFDTYLEEYIGIRDSKEYLLGTELVVLNDIEDIITSDMKMEDKKKTLYDIYILSDNDTYRRYYELLELISIETILTLIDADKCSLGRR